MSQWEEFDDFDFLVDVLIFIKRIVDENLIPVLKDKSLDLNRKYLYYLGMALNNISVATRKLTDQKNENIGWTLLNNDIIDSIDKRWPEFSH